MMSLRTEVKFNLYKDFSIKRSRSRRCRRINIECIVCFLLVVVVKSKTQSTLAFKRKLSVQQHQRQRLKIQESIISLRCGSQDEEDVSADTNIETTTTTNEDEDSVLDENEQMKRSNKKLSSWLDHSLFDINDDIKSEASTVDATRAGSLSSGRGGALIKEKKPPNRFWPSMLDSTKVAPFAARLIHGADDDDDDGSVDDERMTHSLKRSNSNPISDTVVSGAAKSVSKVWWVNTWVDQLPDRDEDEQIIGDEISSSSTVDDEINEMENDVESIVEDDILSKEKDLKKSNQQKKKKKKKQKQENQEKRVGTIELENDQDSSQLPDTDHSDELEKEKESNIVEEQLTLTQNIETADDDATNDIEDFEIQNVEGPVSPYVSSGYWNSIDKAVTLGFVENHPNLRLSTRLRPIRKAAAKVTGFHGVLSGKQHANTSEQLIINADNEQTIEANEFNDGTEKVENESSENVADNVPDDDFTAEENTEIDTVRKHKKKKKKSLEQIFEPVEQSPTEEISALSGPEVDNTNDYSVETGQTESADNVEIGSESQPDYQNIEANNIMPDSEGVRLEEEVVVERPVSPYVSSGYWNSIDRVLTLGFAENHPSWRVSTRLRTVRKAAAKATGLHGVLSGKPTEEPTLTDSDVDEEHLGLIRRRIIAIERARRNVELASERAANASTKRRFFWSKEVIANTDDEDDYSFVIQKSELDRLDEERRRKRVKEIDRLMHEAQTRLSELACEKDVLQRRPNPLFNYTTDEKRFDELNTMMQFVENFDEPDKNNVTADDMISTSRRFIFPPEDLVEEYLTMLFATGRLIRLNHTDLWRNGNGDDYDDEDELSSPLGKLEEERRRRNNNGGSGSWLLRNGLGEKIGQAAETAAYKGVCAALMSVLARSLSSLHGVNVMTYSDIRISTEHAPDLPPPAAGMIPGSGDNRNYAHDAIQGAMRRGARKRRHRRRHGSFIQRDAVVETLTSQCQIAAPLLKLFPIAWQRAMISNILTMVTAIVADFCEGIEFQILGHRLSFSFTPITEEDMIRGMVRGSFNRPRKTNTEEFEAAVRATAEEIGNNLKFLDRWHERALGGGVLRTQIATLIARLVLTLVDDVLCGSKMDLWTDHAGGPRLVAGLEYRTTVGPSGSTVQ